MRGLDPSVIADFDQELSLARAQLDTARDAVLVPQFSAVLELLGEDLWETASSELKSGRYQPRLPIVIDMPKPTGISRPISTLEPLDRLVYQAIADILAARIEEATDRTRVLSWELLTDGERGEMFADPSQKWLELQTKIEQYCKDGTWTHAVRADVANYFERIRQHALVNLLHASGCPSGAINLLEEMLLVWTQRNSHGLLQGLGPSNLLGNFALVGLDAELEVHGIPHLRYVDDLFLFFETEHLAQKGMLDLCRYLRAEGLTLNPLKSHTTTVEELLHEETAFDRLLEEARSEVATELVRDYMGLYELELEWDPEIDVDDARSLHLQAVETLWQQLDDPDCPADRIRRFCLPVFAANRNSIAVEDSLVGVIARPHLARHYARYLWRMSQEDTDVKAQVERTARESQFISDWQVMWVAAALFYMDCIETKTASMLARVATSGGVSVLVRGLCGLAVAKHGTAAQRQILRHHYDNEPSEFVRSSLVFSAQFFPAAERTACLKAWGGQTRMNALVSSAVRILTSST